MAASADDPLLQGVVLTLALVLGAGALVGEEAVDSAPGRLTARKAVAAPYLLLRRLVVRGLWPLWPVFAILAVGYAAIAHFFGQWPAVLVCAAYLVLLGAQLLNYRL